MIIAHLVPKCNVITIKYLPFYHAIFIITVIFDIIIYLFYFSIVYIVECQFPIFAAANPCRPMHTNDASNSCKI